MRRFALMVLAMALASGPAPAAAGVMKQCRKLCKPFIAECVATTDQSRRACKKAFLRPCKLEGLQVCSVTTTTTPTTDSDGTTSTTVKSGGGGGGGGVVSVDVVEASREGDEDPRLYTLAVSIEYSVVTADAVTSVPLDPASFSVLDEDTEIVYAAEPAAAAGDCSAALILAKSGPEITCTLRFRMPASVTDPSAGGAHAKIQFEAQGLHGSRYWSLGS